MCTEVSEFIHAKVVVVQACLLAIEGKMFSPINFDLSEFTWNSLAVRCAECWPSICDSVEAFLIEYPTKGKHINRLRIHLRPDTGLLLFALAGNHKTYCEISSIKSEFLEQQYHKILGGEEFDVCHGNLIENVIAILSATTNNEVVRTSIKNMRDRHHLIITALEYDDEETEREIIR